MRGFNLKVAPVTLRRNTGGYTEGMSGIRRDDAKVHAVVHQRVMDVVTELARGSTEGG